MVFLAYALSQSASPTSSVPLEIVRHEGYG